MISLARKSSLPGSAEVVLKTPTCSGTLGSQHKNNVAAAALHFPNLKEIWPLSVIGSANQEENDDIWFTAYENELRRAPDGAGVIFSNMYRFARGRGLLKRLITRFPRLHFFVVIYEKLLESSHYLVTGVVLYNDELNDPKQRWLSDIIEKTCFKPKQFSKYWKRQSEEFRDAGKKGQGLTIRREGQTITLNRAYCVACDKNVHWTAGGQRQHFETRMHTDKKKALRVRRSQEKKAVNDAKAADEVK
jgi:hypothetical protein